MCALVRYNDAHFDDDKCAGGGIFKHITHKNVVFTQHLRDIDIVLYNCSIYAIWTRACQSSSTSDRSNSVPEAKLEHHLSSSPYTLPRNLSRHIHTATSVRRDESRDTGISGEPASQSLSLLCWIQTQLSKTLRSVSKSVQLSNAHAISVRKMDTRMWMCTFVSRNGWHVQW